jgi:hypothetical protein
MDLSLYRSKRGGRRLVARSDSPSDNVESLTLAGLTTGDYQLELTTDLRAAYGLAWFADDDTATTNAAFTNLASTGTLADMTETSSTGMTAAQAPEPSALALVAAGGAALLSRRRRRTRHAL